MKARLIGVYAANLFDLAATLFFVGMYGIGVELNPFGAVLLGSPPALIAYKVVVVGLLLAVLWRCRCARLAGPASAVLLTVYSVLAVYHIVLLAISACI